MKKQELFLEEAVLDDLAAGMSHLELPVSSKVFRAIFIAVFCIGAVAAGRVLALGLENDFYAGRAYRNASEIRVIPPERGEILDRYGEILAKNQPSFRLTLALSEFLSVYSDPAPPLRALEEAAYATPGSFLDAIRAADALRDDAIVLLPRITPSQVIAVKELGFTGVAVEDSLDRVYENGEAFAHVVGYVGAVSRNDLERNPALRSRDGVGKAGLEAAYDNLLRGAGGEEVRHRDVHGSVIGEPRMVSPTPGSALRTTIDKGLQSYFYARLKSGLRAVGSQAGVGIALNPQNGEVLSLVSIPSFDNAAITEKTLRDPREPLFNRAISGLYAPGSTIKPLVAAAALQEGVFEPRDQVFSRGAIEIPNPFYPELPSRFLDWKPHGWVDVRSALARSSNIYFYAAGGGLPRNESDAFRGVRFPQGLGIERLKAYWEKFGLGEPTGIGIPGEAKGFLPDPATKEKSGGVWRIGDTYNVSIGQGDLLVTPLGLVNYIAAIANGGRIYELHLVEEVPRILRDISGEIGRWIPEVQQGMRDGVREPYGTSHLLADLPFAVSAKTGTAQTNNNQRIDALFLGYASPAAGEDPTIALLVLVENAREGSLNAVPVAKDVLRWYYENRIMNKE